MWKELKNLWSSDNLLKEAWDMSYEAIKIDREMFDEAIESLWGNPTEKTQKLIYRKDKLINKYEREIRKKVITHLAVQGGINLAPGLVLSTVIVDVERIGDYIKNIVELAEMHPKELKADQIKTVLQKMESGIKTLLFKAPICLENGDENLALELYIGTKEVGRTCDDYIRKIITGEVSDLTVESASVLVLYFRYLKRINAHLRNIVSSVINPFDRIGYEPKQSQR